MNDEDARGFEYHPLNGGAGRIKQKTPFGGFRVSLRGSVPNPTLP